MEAATIDAWKYCFDKVAPKLLLYAVQLCPSRADAEDVVQMAFVRWWKRFPEGNEEHIPLLYAAVRTIALDQRRSDTRRSRREAASNVALPMGDAPVFDTSPEQKETALIIQEAMQTLPEDQREVVTLKLWGGLTFAEIATTMGESINTVSGRYRYALQSLQKKLAPRRGDLVIDSTPAATNVVPFPFAKEA
ncbi:RNA polymerase sigma-70 factor (ECF subfamily) [Prosthecobacter fusiformis]|uniref:RNA polymerase sigma-70 factor (ECF subfamily) n=1 Tax=Prosthecobacter fusiformis TaxID=48464 RepID=A0A4R7SPG2_9BACT|nr:sigma-70 family RNA polymerase sigma factor [Prosthecobacter fusiformis]TDU81080.1 RNA polymerase sigma-70 factor (ECF subfamily) [Prosthecobacter fusiformis]